MATINPSTFSVNSIISKRKGFAFGNVSIVSGLSHTSHTFPETGLVKRWADILPIAIMAPVTISKGLHRIGHVKGRCRCC
jgi:hypothetical protein